MPRKSKSSFKPPDWINKGEILLDNCALTVTKNGKKLEIIGKIAEQNFTLVGQEQRNKDKAEVMKLAHQSISRRHAIFGHGSSGNIYIMDLGSAHGTRLNGEKIIPLERRALKDGDVLTFGASTRQYRITLDIDGPDGTIGMKRQREDDEDGRPRKRRKIEGQEIRVRHICIKHNECRRPPKKAQTKEQARQLLVSIRKSLMKLTDEVVESRFAELAAEHSDCKSGKYGGDLGAIEGKYRRDFENVLFDLDEMGVSEIIESPSGLHLALRVR